jgi:hypothetical protein
MIERLDPFSLPQEGLRPLALTENRGDAADNPRAPRAPRRRKPKTTRRKRPGCE